MDTERTSMMSLPVAPAGAESPRAWLFQANPDRYNIEASLAVEREELWNLRQHAKRVHVGDHVGIWLCGSRAGLYAMGTVMTEPFIMSDTAKGIEYWNDPREGIRPRARVLVRYDRVLLDRPLLKEYIECDPALVDMGILRSARGTNFPISLEHWHALRAWADAAVM